MEKEKAAAAATTTAKISTGAKVQNVPDKNKGLDEKVKELKEHLQERLICNIPDEQEPPSLFNINGVDVIPKRSINIVAAQKKSGKSNFAGLLMTACCSSCHSVLNGAIKSNLGALTVLNIDTEQPLKDARRTLRRVMQTAGYGYEEQWTYHDIYSVTVKDLEEEDRQLVTEISIAKYKPQLVFIDGIADMVKSVNDEVENKKAMAWMDYLSCQYDCAIVGMLHLNYGTGKIGGWAGTQANKKFTDSFLLKKDKTNGFFTIEHEGRGKSAPNLRFKIVCPTDQKVGWWEAVDSSVHDNTVEDEKDEKSELQKLIDNAPLPCNTGRLANWIMKEMNFTSNSPANKRIRQCKDYGLIKSQKQGRESIWCKVTTTDNAQEQQLNLSNDE